MEDQKGEPAKLPQQLDSLHTLSRTRVLLYLQLIKALEEARGNGTSMISLIMPPKDQVSEANTARSK